MVVYERTDFLSFGIIYFQSYSCRFRYAVTYNRIRIKRIRIGIIQFCYNWQFRSFWLRTILSRHNKNRAKILRFTIQGNTFQPVIINHIRCKFRINKFIFNLSSKFGSFIYQSWIYTNSIGKYSIFATQNIITTMICFRLAYPVYGNITFRCVYGIKI